MKNRAPKRRVVASATGHSSRRPIYFLVGGLALVVGLVCFVWYRSSKKSPDPLAADSAHQPQEVNADLTCPPGANDPFALPKITPTRFRNANSSVGSVRSSACLECHRDEHHSYLKTTHSRSLAEVDVSREPASSEFDHEISGRHYGIYRDGETLRLRESIQDEGGKQVELANHAASYSLGSGNYARMYLVKVEDFLVEAPMTWYPRRKVWGMSAGYEKDPHQLGFNREIDANCLYCHAGRVENIGGASQRINVQEMAIGCERCHGPGELHIKERKAGLPIQGKIDDSIVNLRHLARERQEDVCSQCHLSASADVAVRGRSRGDFRPGMRMADFVINYRIDRPDSAMTVSGQIEQMRLSRCYVESKTMTCTTCHDPHSLPEEGAKLEHFRSKCLSCHQAEACGAATDARKEKQDNCIVCHMPRGPTDIPHFSFTHHRVGIHEAESKAKKLTEADQLVPVVDDSHLPELERKRLLGLAHDAFAGKLAGGLDDETRDDPSYRALSAVFQERGKKILEDVKSCGLRDPEMDIFFSRLYWRKNPGLCIEYAESALKSPQILPATRSVALYNLASSHFDLRRYERAFPYLQELVKMERSEISLMLLGICHQKLGDLPEAARLIKEAILASPDRADLHSYLATIEQERGNSEEAQRHLQRAQLLRLRVPQPQ